MTVAVAVVATPTEPSDWINVPTPTDGDAIDIVGADVYPLPPPVIVNPETVPAVDTVAVNVVIPTYGKGAPEIIFASNPSVDAVPSTSKNLALSTNIEDVEVVMSDIIFAVG